MGTSISALLIISVLLTAVVVMFKANQIGAELLAVANRNAAETIADKVSTKVEITSTQDFKDFYEVQTSHHANDSEGCRPILPGIARIGEITVANSMDCYWFEAVSTAQITFTVNKILGSPVPLQNRDGTNTRVSIDYFAPGVRITTTNEGSEYIDLSGTTVQRQLINPVSESSTGSSPHRIKLWRYDGTQAGNWGGYQVLMTAEGVPSTDPSTVACVTDFKIKNTGGTSFGAAEIEEKLDIFIILNTDAANTDMKIPVKGTSPLQPNQWTYSIVDDNYQTGTFNPGETMTLVVNLNGEPQVSGTLLIALPNGVDNSYSFPSICSI